MHTQTPPHTYKHTGEVKRKSHGGNSQLCTVNEKLACQDVPHSRINKRGSGSLSPLWHSRNNAACRQEHKDGRGGKKNETCLQTSFWTSVNGLSYLAGSPLQSLYILLSLSRSIRVHLSHDSCELAVRSSVLSVLSAQQLADRMRLRSQSESALHGRSLAWRSNGVLQDEYICFIFVYLQHSQTYISNMGRRGIFLSTVTNINV